MLAFYYNKGNFRGSLLVLEDCAGISRPTTTHVGVALLSALREMIESLAIIKKRRSENTIELAAYQEMYVRVHCGRSSNLLLLCHQ